MTNRKSCRQSDRREANRQAHHEAQREAFRDAMSELLRWVPSDFNGPISSPAPHVAEWLSPHNDDTRIVAACAGCGARIEHALLRLPEGEASDIDEWTYHVLNSDPAAIQTSLDTFHAAHDACSVLVGHALPPFHESTWALPERIPARTRIWADEMLDAMWRLAGDFSVLCCVRLALGDGPEKNLVIPVPAPPAYLDDCLVGEWIRTHLDRAVASTGGGRVLALVMVCCTVTERGSDGRPSTLYGSIAVASLAGVFLGRFAIGSPVPCTRESAQEVIRWKAGHAAPSALFDGLLSVPTLT